jgi:hypothetical protein
MSEIAKAGVELTRYVLIIVSGFLLFSLAIAFSGEYDAAEHSRAVTSAMASAIAPRHLPHEPIESDTATAAARADSGTARFILAQLAEDRAAARAFQIAIVQMVLLNVLLPVLTALLGYVFGSSRRE